jgi:iron uptake system component EfeO
LLRASRSLTLGGAVASLAAIALVSSACTKTSDKPLAGATVVNVALTDDGCKADAPSIGAGPVTFAVKNTNGAKVTEVELLRDGVIMGEKENLTPGLSGTFSLKLDSGSYVLYCPNATTEKWDFTVTGAASASALTPAVTADLSTAVAGYQTYVVGQVDKLVTATKSFTDAVRAGDIAKAKTLFAPARAYYEQVEPVAESFGDLDPGVDARINDVDDPAMWSGFHRIEKALWEDKTTTGMKQYADKLDADMAKLKSLVATTKYQPAQLANGATDLLNEVASSKITGEEDRYSHTDLSDFQANIDGARQAFNLLAPALKVIDPTLASTVDARFADVVTSLQPFKGTYANSGYVDYSTVTDAQRKVLTQKVDALAEPLSQVAAEVTG